MKPLRITFLIITLLGVFSIAVLLSVSSRNSNGSSTKNDKTQKAVNLSDITISDKDKMNIIKGYFMRFENSKNDKFVVLRDDKYQTVSYVLTETPKFTYKNDIVDESFFKSGDVITIELIDSPNTYRHAFKVNDFTYHYKLVELNSMYSNFTDTTSWTKYSKNFNGYSFSFKYPNEYNYYDEDLSSPISFYKGSTLDMTSIGFEIDRTWKDTKDTFHSFIENFKNNYNNYREEISTIEKVTLPNNVVYKVTINSTFSDRSFNLYFVESNNAVARLEKYDLLAEKDLYTIINSLQISCKTDC